MVIVTKFGGTSVSDAKSVSNAVDIIRKDKKRRIVVVSAPAGLTDLLLGFADENYDARIVSEEARKIQIGIVQEKFDATRSHYNVEHGSLDGLYAQLEKELGSSGEKSREEYRDAVAVFGERINAKLVAEIIKTTLKLRSRFLMAEDIGMHTDSQFGNATLSEESTALIKQYFEKVPNDEVCVVTGYYGVDKLNRPVTFGRDGSNYVAAVIASAIGAELLENFSDKKGICRANPKLVPEAENDIIPELTFEEARELAYSGAKILHPLTMIPLARNNVPVRVRSTFDYGHPGTLIHSGANSHEVKGVAEKNMYRLKISKVGMNETRGYIARLSAILRDAGIDIHLLSASIDSVACAFTFPSINNVDELKERFKVLEERIKNDHILKPDVYMLEDIAVICVVGKGIQRITGVAADLQTALAGKNILGSDYGASNRNIIYMVSPENLNAAVTALYKTVKQINKSLGGEK